VEADGAAGHLRQVDRLLDLHRDLHRGDLAGELLAHGARQLVLGRAAQELLEPRHPEQVDVVDRDLGLQDARRRVDPDVLERADDPHLADELGVILRRDDAREVHGRAARELRLRLVERDLEALHLELERQLRGEEILHHSLGDRRRHRILGQDGLPALELPDPLAQPVDLALEDDLLRVELAPALVAPAARGCPGEGQGDGRGHPGSAHRHDSLLRLGPRFTAARASWAGRIAGSQGETTTCRES
jgi:hypothetical protein